MSVVVRLPQFEGPLGLLLYLIRKEEMDIANIQIHEITKQYLDYIKIIRDFDLEAAGEFVAMAATLLQIKSKMLLPQYDEHGEEVEVDDPRKELVNRLLEYQKYQNLSQKLNERMLLGRDLWPRGYKEDLSVDEMQGQGDVVIEENGLFSLISMYRVMLKKIKKKAHTVYAKGQSVASRILEIKDRLIMGKRITLRELVLASEQNRTKLLITFLSLLELGRLGFVSLFQSEVYADIHVEPKKLIERDVVTRVDEFETNAEKFQEQLFGKRNLNVDFIEDDDETTEQMALRPQVENGVLEEVEMAAEMATDEELALAEQELGLNEVNVEKESDDYVS